MQIVQIQMAVFIVHVNQVILEMGLIALVWFSKK